MQRSFEDAASTSEKSPSEYHAQALSLAKGGDTLGALPLFRAACRGAPRNTKFLNDLGVTEMRQGHLEKAKFRFRLAMGIDPTSKSAEKAIKNLKEVEEFMSPEMVADTDRKVAFKLSWMGFGDASLSTFVPDTVRLPTQQHELSPFPVVYLKDLEDLTNTTARKYLKGDVPFLLLNAMKDWDLSLWTPESLAETFGGQNVDYYPHNMEFETVKPYFTNLKDALKQFKDPTGTYDRADVSQPTTYIQWNVNEGDWSKLKSSSFKMRLPAPFETDDVWIDECFPESSVADKFHIRTHWRMLLIGQKGAGMFNHKDTLQSSSFQAQIMGRKRWHLCSDAETPNIYKAGELDTFNPNYEKFPKAKNLNCYQIDIIPGQMLYYPQNYWHHTMNLDDLTMAISGTLVTEGNRPGITKEFLRECKPSKDGKARIFGYDEELCAGLEKCFKLWEEKDWEGDLGRDTLNKRKERAVWASGVGEL